MEDAPKNNDLLDAVAMLIWHKTPDPKLGRYYSTFRSLSASDQARYRALAIEIVFVCLREPGGEMDRTDALKRRLKAVRKDRDDLLESVERNREENLSLHREIAKVRARLERSVSHREKELLEVNRALRIALRKLRDSQQAQATRHKSLIESLRMELKKVKAKAMRLFLQVQRLQDE